MENDIRREGERIRDHLIAEFRKIAEEDARAYNRMLAYQREMRAILDRIDLTLDRMGVPRSR